MPAYETLILRQVGFRDHNFKPLASNDPSSTTTGWTTDPGVAATTDGDILSLSGTTGSKGVSRSFPGLNSSSFPYAVIRAKGSGTLDVVFGSDTFTIGLSSTYQTFTFTLSPGATKSTVKFQNQNVPGTNSIDLVAVCAKTPITVSSTDLYMQIITDMGLSGVSHVELELNNLGGKYLPGGANELSFGDHVHCYLPSTANPGGDLFHRYGGTIEMVQPGDPPTLATVHSRAYGLNLMETIILANFQNQTSQQILNSILDNYVNAASKDGVPIASGYQLTRSFVQNIGSAIGLYQSNLLRAREAMLEVADLTVAQGWPSNNPATFFVDPAENLHLVPLGARGAANWLTDPYPAVYPTALSVGAWQITNSFRRDIKSLCNRAHYYAISQIPGLVDAWTEFPNDAGYQAQWDSENGVAGQSVTWSRDTSRVAIGASSAHAKLNADTTTTASQWRLFTPKAKNLGLDIASMGSPNSPPLFDFFWRMTHTGDAGNVNPTYIFFATDASNRFLYKFIDQGPGIGGIASTTIANLTSDLVPDQWYRFFLPVGPNAGTLFANPPTLNGIVTASFTGSSNYQISQVGTPSWSNINYVGYQTDFNPPSTGKHQDFYFDGWRFLGGRYILAYDSRAAAPPFDLAHRYPEMRENHFFDPVAKDEAVLRNFATAELLRLRNPILRGSFVCPIMGDALAEQQVLAAIPSAGFPSPTYFRIQQAVHTLTGSGMLTELTVSDDFVNSQTLSPFKLTNALMQMGENAILNRQIYDLKTFIADPNTKPVLLPVA